VELLRQGHESIALYFIAAALSSLLRGICTSRAPAGPC
jgi:hypothetical protein